MQQEGQQLNLFTQQPSQNYNSPFMQQAFSIQQQQSTFQQQSSNLQHQFSQQQMFQQQQSQQQPFSNEQIVLLVNNPQLRASLNPMQQQQFMTQLHNIKQNLHKPIQTAQPIISQVNMQPQFFLPQQSQQVNQSNLLRSNQGQQQKTPIITQLQMNSSSITGILLTCVDIPHQMQQMNMSNTSF